MLYLNGAYGFQNRLIVGVGPTTMWKHVTILGGYVRGLHDRSEEECDRVERPLYR